MLYSLLNTPKQHLSLTNLPSEAQSILHLVLSNPLAEYVSVTSTLDEAKQLVVDFAAKCKAEAAEANNQNTLEAIPSDEEICADVEKMHTRFHEGHSNYLSVKLTLLRIKDFCPEVKLSLSLMAMFLSAAKTPGQIVQLVHMAAHLRAVTDKKQHPIINIGVMANVLRGGWPSEHAMSKLWQLQKKSASVPGLDSSDNRLDYSAEWKEFYPVDAEAVFPE